MTIFEFARIKEKQAEKVYRRLAEIGFNKGMTNIFEMLADAEKLHSEITEKMGASEKIEILDSGILHYTKETINKIRFGKEKFNMTPSLGPIFETIQALEAENEKFYRKHARKATDKYHRKVLLLLAEQEHQHYTIMGDVIDFFNFHVNSPENSDSCLHQLNA
ncbi:MAG: ferritin family protein [Candidatus Riflebacteria bacterium]|nr:ferritin family protein [Candidatus Riflebacteria bacterium]